VVVFGRHYAKELGINSLKAFGSYLANEYPEKHRIITWGSEGAAYIDRSDNISYIKAKVINRVVDTRAAGDVFNAGLINGLIHKADFMLAVTQAVELAGKKCMQMGIEKLAN
jgi:sugar/nucleoside kinase (ribokinase family)